MYDLDHGKLEEIILKAPLHTKKPMTNTDAQLWRTTRYEQLFGLYDHVNDHDDRSIATVALHPGEQYWDENSPHFERMLHYLKMKIKDRFGLSFSEYLEYPRHIQELMNKAIEVYGLDEKAQQAQAEAEIREAMNGNG